MAAITSDLSQLPKDVRERIRSTLSDRYMAKIAIAKLRQAKLHQIYNAAAVPGVTHKDFGPCTMVIDPMLEWHFSRVCDAKELVWNDPEFIKWLKKKGPEFFVREAPTKVQVGYR